MANMAKHGRQAFLRSVFKNLQLFFLEIQKEFSKNVNYMKHIVEQNHKYTYYNENPKMYAILPGVSGEGANQEIEGTQ